MSTGIAGPALAQLPETPPAPSAAPPAPVREPTEPPPGDTAAAPESDPPKGSPKANADLAEIEAALAADAAAGDESTASTQADRANAAPTAPTRQSAGTQSMNPDLSLILDVAAAYFSEDENLQTGGHDPTQTGFNLQQLELSVGAAVDPYFRFDGNLVFSLFGVEVEEAYGTTLDLPAGLQLRAGQFLTRFGRINATHPHSWDFVDQPFAIGRVFGGEGSRGLGVELSWLTPLPWYVEVLASSTEARGEATARSFFGADDPGIDDPGDLQTTAAIKQFFPLGENWSLLWGLSGANGPNASGDGNRTDVYGSDLYVKFRPITRESTTIVSLQTEWLLRRRQVPADVLTDVSGYAQLFWRFAQRWGMAGRWEYGSPETGTRAESRAVALDPAWTSARHRIAANLTFWPTEFSRLRLQGSSDLPGWLPDPIYAGFLTLELVTGAHGAHAF
jgi:hypothetical protein